MGDKEKEGGVVLFSFGYKYGTPVDVNLLLDMRCLPNPYWVEELRPKTGQVAEVAAYVLESERGRALLEKITPALEMLVQQHVVEDGRILRIGVGCTGGRHRSVAVVESLGQHFSDRGAQLTLFHRDIHRDDP